MRLYALAAALVGLLAALPAGANTLTVPGQYATIQSAVNAAQPGDTISVSPNVATPGNPNGYYQEFVHITTNGIRLVGIHNPVLDGSTLGTPGVTPSPALPYFGNNGITVDADNVTITGFTIQNYYYYVNTGGIPPLAGGIRVNPTASGDVHDNVLAHNGEGLEIEGPLVTPQTFSITDNDISCSFSAGVDLESVSGDIVVAHNEIFSNGNHGLSANTSSGLKVRHNDVYGNGALFSLWGNSMGIIISGSGVIGAPPSIVELNNVYSNTSLAGIYIFQSANQTISHNVVTQNSMDGIDLDFCSQGTVSVDHNTADYNGFNGITLFDFTSGCAVAFNDASSNANNGILLDVTTSGNTVSHNTAFHNLVVDEEDDTVPISNTWSKNKYGTSLPSNLPN